MMFYFINYNYDGNILLKVLFGNKTFNLFFSVKSNWKIEVFLTCWNKQNFS